MASPEQFDQKSFDEAIEAINTNNDPKKYPKLLNLLSKALKTLKGNAKKNKTDVTQSPLYLHYFKLRAQIDKVFEELNGHLDAAETWTIQQEQICGSQTVPPVPPEIIDAINKCMEQVNDLNNEISTMIKQQNEQLKRIEEIL